MVAWSGWRRPAHSAIGGGLPISRDLGMAEARLRLLPELPIFDAWARGGIDRIRFTAG